MMTQEFKKKEFGDTKNEDDYYGNTEKLPEIVINKMFSIADYKICWNCNSTGFITNPETLEEKKCPFCSIK